MHGMYRFMGICQANFRIFALLALMPVLALASQDVELNIVKGEAALQNANYDEAVGLLQEALAEEPENQDALYFLGQAYAALDDFTEALKYFEQVTTEEWPIEFDRGVAQYRNNQYRQAVTSLTKAVKKDYNPILAKFYLGVSKYKIKDYAGAAQDLKDVENVDDQMQSYALLYLGLARNKAGDPKGSQAAIEKLQEQYPDSKAAKTANDLGEDMSGEVSEPTEPEYEREKPVKFKILTGIQYDTNPELVQTDQQVALDTRSAEDATRVTDHGALRTFLDFGFKLSLIDLEVFSWDVIAQTYFNVHFPVTDAYYYNFMRNDLQTSFAVKLNPFIIEFGGGYNISRSQFLNFSILDSDESEVVSNQDGLVDKALLVFGQRFSKGFNVNVAGIYEISDIDRARIALIIGKDQYGTDGEFIVPNDRDGLMISAPMEYRRILLKEFGLTAIGGITPMAYRTDRSASDFAFRGVGLSASATFAPRPWFNSGLVLSWSTLNYYNGTSIGQDDGAGNIIATQVDRSDKNIDALLYAGFQSKRWKFSGSAQWTRNFSNEFFDYKRAIYGVEAGLRF